AVFVIRLADPGGEGRVVGGRRHIAALEGGKQAGDRPGEGELFRPGRRVQQLGFVDSPKFRLRPPLTPFARLSRRYCRLLAETVSMRAGLKKRPSRDAAEARADPGPTEPRADPGPRRASRPRARVVTRANEVSCPPAQSARRIARKRGIFVTPVVTRVRGRSGASFSARRVRRAERALASGE